MRKISIRELVCPDINSEYTGNTLYRVFLGNNLRRFFANRKHAKTYLADANRFLNARIHELNYIYIYVFGEYRRNWFYFDSGAPARRQMLIKCERGIVNNFSSIDKAFTQAIRRSGMRNGNYITFQQLYLICDGLKAALMGLKSVMLERKYYAEVQRLDMFTGQVETLKEKLTGFGRLPDGADPVTWRDPYVPEDVENE